MSTQHLGYLGGGVLLAIVVLTLIGVPPELWIAAALVAVVIGGVAFVAVRQGQAHGSDLAQRFVAARANRTANSGQPSPSAPAPDVDVELVRAADEASGTPAVWLHRRGGRRAHRYQTKAGWTVERVSTKDPDNPKKRVIGESLTFASEAGAVAAANDLVQGQDPAARVGASTRLTAEAQA